jgi:hypothetical protein
MYPGARPSMRSFLTAGESARTDAPKEGVIEVKRLQNMHAIGRDDRWAIGQ